MRILWALAGLLVVGCAEERALPSSDDATLRDTDGTTQRDVAPTDTPADNDGYGTADDGAAEPGDTAGADTSEDVTPDTAPPTPDTAPPTPDADAVPTDAGPVPVACAVTEACGVRLDPDGLCPGACIPQHFGLDCPGVVQGGLCLGANPPPEGALVEGEPTPLEWTAGDVATDFAIGDEVLLTYTATNPGASPAKVDVFLDRSSDWEAVTSDFDAASVTLAAGETRALTARLRAARANGVEPWSWRIATAYLGQRLISHYGRIGYPEGTGVSCGGRTFPATYCPDGSCTGPMGGFYISAVCCDGVFYPGSLCCADSDCAGAHCVDGRCVAETPGLAMANTLPTGRQRVLLAIVDDPAADGLDACVDRAATLGPTLELPAVEAWFDAVSAARAGADLLSLDWVVLTGLRSADFASDPYGYPDPYLGELDAWLGTLGCDARFADFDKVIVISPTLNIGATAIAMPRGLIVSTVATLPLLFAHELGHTFGASDIYLDLGATFRYRADLMGNNLGYFGAPTDGVLRGEVGYLDLDDNGVVDVAEFADAPDALVLVDPRAVRTKKGPLEISFEIGADQAGEHLRALVPDFHVEVPGRLEPRDMTDGRRRKVVVIEQLLDVGATVTLNVSAALGFTNAAGVHGTRTLEVSVPLVVTAE